MSLNKIEILRSKPGVNISGVLPSTAIVALKPMMLSDYDTDGGPGARTLALANNRMDGLLMRESRVATGNPRTDTERQWGGDGTNAEIESPFVAGGMGTIERVESLIAEGIEYVLSSGTALINSSTQVGTNVSCEDGMFCVAQAAQWAQWRLAAQLTPEDSGNTCRIQLEEIPGFLVPA